MYHQYACTNLHGCWACNFTLFFTAWMQEILFVLCTLKLILNYFLQLFYRSQKFYLKIQSPRHIICVTVDAKQWTNQITFTNISIFNICDCRNIWTINFVGLLLGVVDFLITNAQPKTAIITNKTSLVGLFCTFWTYWKIYNK